MNNKFLISQLAHVELFTPKPDESVHFFKEIWGLEETERVGQSVYLRAWDDLYHHSLKITEAKGPGLAHIGWRATSKESIEEAAKIIEMKGLGKGWIDGDQGHGPAYQFYTPGGHLSEIFWDVSWYEAPIEKKSVWNNRPQKLVRRGVGVRRLDHVTCVTPTPTECREFYQDLGFKWNEAIYTSKSNKEIASWMAVSSLSHDVAFLELPYYPNGGRAGLEHVCYAVDSREEVLLAADTLIEHGFKLAGGPTRHGVGEGFYLYVYEPGGNKIELYSGSHLIFAPDYGPVKWKIEENPNSAWSEENIMTPLDK